MKLHGKVALITGSARRIGRAMALALAERGVRVAIHYNRSQQDASRTCTEARRHRIEAECFQADLRNPNQIRKLATQVRKKFKHIDILINNASIYEPAPTHEGVSTEDFDRMIETNLRAPYLLIRLLAPTMVRRKAGKIINLVDWTGTRPDPNFIPYSASRAGLISITQSCALAYAPHVQVNAIAPGAILPPENGGRKAMAGAIARTPLQRKGSTEDVVKAMLYLLEHSDYITGHTLFVDGGRFLHG